MGLTLHRVGARVSPSGVVRNGNNFSVVMAHKPEDIVWRNLRYTHAQA